MSPLAIGSFASTVLRWTTPQKQIKYLLAEKDFQQWETFRDSLVQRWLNTNIMVGCLPLENAVVDQSIFSVV
jgi:hypothetical protein